LTAEELAGTRDSSMSEESVLRDLFDRWERVWHEGQYDLVAGCLAQVYIRHDESGTRRVTAEEYATKVAAERRERPNTRFIVYDHEIARDRAWFRFTLRWTDPSNGETRTRAAMQLYRIEGGKLAETWLTLLKVGSAWPDAAGQGHWTSKRPPPARDPQPGSVIHTDPLPDGYGCSSLPRLFTKERSNSTQSTSCQAWSL
jgi:SnoaL-like domain